MKDYHFEPLSQYRVTSNNVLALSSRHCYPIHINIEIIASELLRYKKTKGVGVNAILTKTIASVIKENPKFSRLNSVLKRGFFTNRLMLAHHVSFSVAQDKLYGDEKVASVYILENADQKTLQEIDKELKRSQEMKLEELPIYGQLKFLVFIPHFLQKILFFIFSLFPSKKAVTFVSVGFTNLGKSQIELMTPVTPKTIFFGIGGLRDQLFLEDEKAKSRKVFTLNMMLNHYVVDGKICSEFLSEVKRKLETLC